MPKPRLTDQQAEQLAEQKWRAEQEAEKRRKNTNWYYRMKARKRKYGDYE